MKRIIFINRFYRPDHSSTAQLLTDLASKLSIENSEVHVIASRSYYSGDHPELVSYEVLDGVHVHRAWSSKFGRKNIIGRSVDYFSFYLTSFLLMLRLVRRGDILVAKTDPPMISIFAALVVTVKRGVLINWVQDLFPEIAVALGMKLFKPAVVYPIVAIRNWSLKVASVNVVLGAAMKEKISGEIGDRSQVEIIPNWTVSGECKPIKRAENFLVDEWSLSDKFVIGHSGNLGRAHDYKTILGAAIELQSDENIVFLFIGGGAGYDLLESAAREQGLKNIIFKPYQPIEKLSYSLSVPNVHLLSLEPELEGLILPSKYYGILSVGRPIINIGSDASDIGKEIADVQCGYTANIGDVESLVNVIKRLSEGALDDYENNAAALYQRKYSYGLSISHWQNTIDGCMAQTD